MRIPNADAAVIAQDKLCEYLLNPDHRRGGSKAKLLNSLGYSKEEWRRFESDIRAQHLVTDAEEGRPNGYGPRYEIVAPLQGPSGQTLTFRSVWQIDFGTDVPRFITMYPEWA
ncbi:MAG TPA: hypothetical protein VHR72_03375 [Gemmataceae bacterium]|nr:hypothetical protein [Gemmataceae bacterium]